MSHQPTSTVRVPTGAPVTLGAVPPDGGSVRAYVADMAEELAELAVRHGEAEAADLLRRACRRVRTGADA